MIQKMSIDQLLPLCKEKDQRAQLEVYQRYHLAMYHSALRIVRNPALVAFATLGNPLEKSTQRWLVLALFDWRQNRRFFIDAGQHDGS